MNIFSKEEINREWTRINANKDDALTFASISVYSRLKTLAQNAKLAVVKEYLTTQTRYLSNCPSLATVKYCLTVQIKATWRFFNHGWTQMNTDVGATVKNCIRVHPCLSVVQFYQLLPARNQFPDIRKMVDAKFDFDKQFSSRRIDFSALQLGDKVTGNWKIRISNPTIRKFLIVRNRLNTGEN